MNGQVEVKGTKRDTNNLRTGPIRKQLAHETDIGPSEKTRTRSKGRMGNQPAVIDRSGDIETPNPADMNNERTSHGARTKNDYHARKRTIQNRIQEAQIKRGRDSLIPLTKIDKDDHLQRRPQWSAIRKRRYPNLRKNQERGLHHAPG